MSEDYVVRFTPTGDNPKKNALLLYLRLAAKRAGFKVLQHGEIKPMARSLANEQLSIRELVRGKE
jgi:hypothetical protein